MHSWDGLRSLVKSKGTPLAKRELALGDEVLYTEPDDRHVVAESVILAKLNGELRIGEWKIRCTFLIGC